MDITQLAHDITQHLFTTAALYAVLKETGKGASSEIGKRLIGAAGDKTKALLEKLWPKIEAKPEALEVVKDIALAPDDPDNLALFRMQLKKLLTEDESLAKDIARLFEEVKAAGEATVIQSGDRNVYVGGNVHGGINTGDKQS